MPIAVINQDVCKSPHGDRVLSLTLRDRVLSSWRMSDVTAHNALTRSGHTMTPGAAVDSVNWNPLTLEEVRDNARRRATAFDAVDIVRSLPLWHIDYRGHAELPAGRLAARYQMGGGQWSDPMPMTRRALLHFCGDVLPPRGAKYNDHLCALGDRGKALATLCTAAFTQASKLPPRRVRTYRRTDVDGVERQTVRAVTSDTYGCYSDVDLLDLLLNEPDFAQLPVLSYHATDRGMKVRCALEHMDGPPVVGRPIPMVELENSEVRAGSVGLMGGLWTLHCTNGVAGWTESLCRRWNHSGNMNRIGDGVPGALEELRVVTSGYVEQYVSALDVAVDDAIRWMEQELLGDLTAHQLSEAQNALILPSASLAPAGTLARVVDAITYSAQAIRDPFAAETVERAGGRLLSRGLSTATSNRIKVIS